MEHSAPQNASHARTTAGMPLPHKRVRSSAGIMAEVHMGAGVLEGRLIDVAERSLGLSGVAGLRCGDALAVKLPARRILRGNVVEVDSAGAHILLSVPLHPDDPLLYAG